MKIYLDDIRKEPDNWIRCYWPYEVINLLKTNNVSELSLDHDLGNDTKGTGYDVLLWIEEEIYFNKSFKLPNIKIHSSNTSAKLKMLKAIEKIKRIDHENSIL